MSKEAHNLLWESHSAELNDIGPPYHSTPEWKKIWSVKKRQCLDVESQQEVASGMGYLSFIIYLLDTDCLNFRFAYKCHYSIQYCR